MNQAPIKTMQHSWDYNEQKISMAGVNVFLAHRDKSPESYCRTVGVCVRLHKNFNLAYNSWTTIGSLRALIFHMCIPCDNTFLVTLTLKFDLLLKNFNLGHSFLTRRGRVFIFHMYIPCDKTFPWVPKHLT